MNDNGLGNRDMWVFGDVPLLNRNTGKSCSPQSLPQPLAMLMRLVNDKFSKNFNTINANRYVNGDDYIKAHSDHSSSPSFVDGDVLGISVGATRTFRIRNIDDGQIVNDLPTLPYHYVLMAGDVLSSERLKCLQMSSNDSRTSNPVKHFAARYIERYRNHVENLIGEDQVEKVIDVLQNYEGSTELPETIEDTERLFEHAFTTINNTNTDVQNRQTPETQEETSADVSSEAVENLPPNVTDDQNSASVVTASFQRSHL